MASATKRKLRAKKPKRFGRVNEHAAFLTIDAGNVAHFDITRATAQALLRIDAGWQLMKFDYNGEWYWSSDEHGFIARSTNAKWGMPHEGFKYTWFLPGPSLPEAVES
jgi:hypothetical protein